MLWQKSALHLQAQSPLNNSANMASKKENKMTFVAKDLQKQDCIQGTREWLRWRAGIYTASDAAAVVGQNKWFPKTPYQLWQRKTGQKETTVNPAMRAGNEDEPLARALIEEKIGKKLSVECWQSVIDGMHLGASYDGICWETKECYEIKRPMRGTASDMWVLEEPGHYRWQMVHQLLVHPELNACHLTVYAHDANQIKIAYTIRRSDADFDAWAATLIKGWSEFHESISDLRPPSLLEQDTIVIDTPAFKKLAKAYLEAKKEAEFVNDRLQKARNDIIESISKYGPGASVAGGGIIAYNSFKSGKINWKSKELKEELKNAGINLENYRLKSEAFWTVKEGGNVE